MKGKYLRRIGGLILATLMFAGIAFFSPSSVQAQGRRRVLIVRPYPYRFYRPYGPWGYGWGYPYGYGYPYGTVYSQYVFDNGDQAASQGYNDGFRTGRDDGKKNKSFNPERSHYFHDSGFGNFAEAYRSGFSRGYQDGYRAGNSHLG